MRERYYLYTIMPFHAGIGRQETLKMFYFGIGVQVTLKRLASIA